MSLSSYYFDIFLTFKTNIMTTIIITVKEFINFQKLAIKANVKFEYAYGKKEEIIINCENQFLINNNYIN